MKRRDFLTLTPLASLAVLMNGLPVNTLAANPLLQLLAKQSSDNGRVLVLVQLIGGNDGLNTIIPIDQYERLVPARSNITIPEEKILKLADTGLTGLHPVMKEINSMYGNGQVSIIQGVNYPDPDLSHFRSTDIWLTGSDGKQYLDTGWIARYLDEVYGLPEQQYPLAVQIGTSISIGLLGPHTTMGTAISDVNGFYDIVNGSVGTAPNTPAGNELTFIRNIVQQTNRFNNSIQQAAQKANNLTDQYPTSYLAEQLKIVARLIAGGLPTPVYIVSLPNFDTHSSQADFTDHTRGIHANLLTDLSKSMSAFFDDCKRLNIENRVAAMTFSEFGRRIKSNGSLGTDHGTAQPIMVFSNAVNPGIIGSNPVIPQDVTPNDNVATQTDFRSVYAAVLADWFMIPPDVVNKILLKEYPVSPIFKHPKPFVPDADLQLEQNYPNPFKQSTTIVFFTRGGYIQIELLDMTGRKIRTIASQQYAAGRYELILDRNGLSQGNYICRMSMGSAQSARKIMVIDY